MSVTGERKIDLKVYPAPEMVSDTQINELLYSKVSSCPDIKSVTPNPKIGIAAITGKFNNYTVEHKHDQIHVRPKINYGISVILSAFSIPFALWFVYAFDFVSFATYALPLAFLLISFGIAWFVGYTLGDKEQKVILSYIYNILKERPVDSPVENAKGVGGNKLLAIVPFIIGIFVIVMFFVFR